MAKRLSSLFSLGSDHSDQSSESRQSSSLHPARPPKKQRSIQSLRDQSSTHLARKSLPDLRPSSNLYALDEQSSGFTPPFDPSILPQIVDDAMLLQPPTQLKPMPLRSQSPDGSVAGSRPISRGSRQESGASSYLTCRPESRSASRPASPTNFLALPPTSRSSSRSASRPASPIKFLAPPTTSHPLTPTTEPRLRRRKSWMPGKLRKESADEGTTANSPQAWIVMPKEKILYDLNPLASFHKASNLRRFS